MKTYKILYCVSLQYKLQKIEIYTLKKYLKNSDYKIAGNWQLANSGEILFGKFIYPFKCYSHGICSGSYADLICTAP